MVMELLLVVGGFNVDGDVELTLVNANIDNQGSGMGQRGVPGKADGIATVESFKEGN